MEYDLHNSVLQVVATKTTLFAGDAETEGETIDTNTDGGFESVEFIVQSGVLTAGTFTSVLEDSDTGAFGGEETLVDSELVLGALPVFVFATGEDDVTKRVGTITKKQFVRLNIVGSGTAGGTIGAVAVLSNARTRPTPAVITP